MPEETLVPAAPARKRGRPKTRRADSGMVVTPVRQVCEWCRMEVLAGQNPPQWVVCQKCQAIDTAFQAETPCPDCGGRKARSVAGVQLTNGHRDSCITNAPPPVEAHR